MGSCCRRPAHVGDVDPAGLTGIALTFGTKPEVDRLALRSTIKSCRAKISPKPRSRHISRRWQISSTTWTECTDLSTPTKMSGRSLAL